MPIEKLRPSFTFTEDRLKQLEQVVPEAFADGKIDWETLQEALGEQLEDSRKEHFGLSWPGKREARRLASIPSKGTLVPCPGEGVNEDDTENIFIEGENLEVLKLLQKSYAGKIKMIYIDPPYNTGNDFIYNDNFTDPLDAYLKYTGAKGEGGEVLTSNTRADGRFHSRWLNMMYPRLILARQLLRQDGVIFISIDDNEVHHLRQVMNEIFGEENNIATLIWNKQHSQQQGLFKKYHEYVLLFAKDLTILSNIEGGEGIIEAGALKKISKANPESEFEFPAHVRFEAKHGSVFTGTFGDSEKVTVVNGTLISEDGFTKEKVTLSAGWTQKNQMIAYFNGETVFDSKGQKVVEFYFSSSGKLKCLKERTKITPPTLLPKFGMVSEQTAYITSLFGLSVFDNPKPVEMLELFINWFTTEGDYVMDFFCGSGTTAEAALQTGRKFICVQFPEFISSSDVTGQNAISLGLLTISDLAKERIRLVLQKSMSQTTVLTTELPGMRNEVLTTEDNSHNDLGFSGFTYTNSNFIRRITSSIEDIDALRPLFDNDNFPLVMGWKKNYLLSEILLQEGFPLICNKMLIEDFLQNEVYSISAPDFCTHDLFVCFDEVIQPATVELLKMEKKDIFICLDSALTDELKARLTDRFNVHVI